MLNNTLKLNFYYLKSIHILHPRYQPKKIGYILKNKQKNMYVCIHEIIWLIIMKMKTNMKNRSHRYYINRPRSRHGHICSRYKKYLRIMMLISIKHHLSNYWSLIHEKFKQHWDWAEKKRCLILPRVVFRTLVNI